jgi:hypothetical protein
VLDVGCGRRRLPEADLGAALAEARRVTRSGGRVAICNRGRAEDREVHAILEPLSRLDPRPGDPPSSAGRGARIARERTGEVEVPYAFPDRATLERALLAIAPVYGVGPEAAERFRRADGSYRFENRFRYLIAEVP